MPTECAKFAVTQNNLIFSVLRPKNICITAAAQKQRVRGVKNPDTFATAPSPPPRTGGTAIKSALSQESPIFPGFRFFESDWMIMRAGGLGGEVTPECLIAASTRALISA
jgi:hypothetical protein